MGCTFSMLYTQSKILASNFTMAVKSQIILVAPSYELHTSSSRPKMMLNLPSLGQLLLGKPRARGGHGKLVGNSSNYCPNNLGDLTRSYTLGWGCECILAPRMSLDYHSCVTLHGRMSLCMKIVTSMASVHQELQYLITFFQFLTFIGRSGLVNPV